MQTLNDYKHENSVSLLETYSDLIKKFPNANHNFDTICKILWEVRCDVEAKRAIMKKLEVSLSQFSKKETLTITE